MQLPDPDLVRRVLGGSEDAARELVERYQRPVFNLIARMTLDAATAEDLAQEAFVKAFAHLDSYDSRYKFSSWMFRIAHNVAVDHLRRPRLATSSIDEAADGQPPYALQLPGTGPSPLELAERNELAALVDRAMGQLRPDYREALVLRYQEGLSYDEIAEVLDMPLGTVKSNIHRARAELAVLLDQWLQPGGPALRKA